MSNIDEILKVETQMNDKFRKLREKEMKIRAIRTRLENIKYLPRIVITPGKKAVTKKVPIDPTKPRGKKRTVVIAAATEDSRTQVFDVPPKHPLNPSKNLTDAEIKEAIKSIKADLNSV